MEVSGRVAPPLHRPRGWHQHWIILLLPKISLTLRGLSGLFFFWGEGCMFLCCKASGECSSGIWIFDEEHRFIWIFPPGFLVRLRGWGFDMTYTSTLGLGRMPMVVVNAQKKGSYSVCNAPVYIVPGKNPGVEKNTTDKKHQHVAPFSMAVCGHWPKKIDWKCPCKSIQEQHFHVRTFVKMSLFFWFFFGAGRKFICISYIPYIPLYGWAQTLLSDRPEAWTVNI